MMNKEEVRQYWRRKDGFSCDFCPSCGRKIEEWK